MHKPFFEKVGFGDPYVIRMIPDDDIPRKIVSFCKREQNNPCCGCFSYWKRQGGCI